MDDDDLDEIPLGQLRRENFLYLLHEMECALDRGGIEWSIEEVGAAFSRLLLITVKVGGIAGRLEPADDGRPPDRRRGTRLQRGR